MRMGALELIFFSPTISPTTSKPLSLLSSNLRPSSFSLSFRSSSPSFLQLRPLRRCTSGTAAGGFDDDDDVDEKFEDLEDGEVAEDSDPESYSMIDVETLEEEARHVVREFSSSLSNELRIGAFFLF